ncbi:MAG: hypothetical protein ACE5SW_03180 [Nitrososphaeraceae archaeon]
MQLLVVLQVSLAPVEYKHKFLILILVLKIRERERILAHLTNVLGIRLSTPISNIYLWNSSTHTSLLERLHLIMGTLETL